MLPTRNRLTTKDIARLFWHSRTQKIIAYPFVYFVGAHHALQTNTKWGIQLSTKIHKSSVKRHIVKRIFYDAITKTTIKYNSVSVLAVPQKARIEEVSLVLATQDKNAIVTMLTKQFSSSLSQLSKKLWSSVESKKQWLDSSNVKNV